MVMYMNEINGQGLTDDEIKQNVFLEMSSRPDFYADNISLDFEDGELTLYGEVDSVEKKWLAEQIACDVMGIVHVNNKLNVTDC